MRKYDAIMYDREREHAQNHVITDIFMHATECWDLWLLNDKQWFSSAIFSIF